MNHLWEEEFSVEALEEKYVSRRQFAKFLVLTSAGMAAGQLWILFRRLFATRLAPGEKIVARADEIPVGGVKLFRYPDPDDPCLLVRLPDGSLVAYDQRCTHLSCAVFFSRESLRIECPCHNGVFSVADGSVIQGPPTRPLPRILLEERNGDIVAIGVDLQTKA